MRRKSPKKRRSNQNAADDLADHSGLAQLTSQPSANHRDQQHDRHLNQEQCHSAFLLGRSIPVTCRNSTFSRPSAFPPDPPVSPAALADSTPATQCTKTPPEPAQNSRHHAPRSYTRRLP